jgi:hypothetical protein
MTKTIKLFLPKEFHEELLYQYEDKDADLRKLVFGFLKPLGKQGKMVLLNKSIQARVLKNGQMTMEEKDLKDIDLEKTAVKPDDNWIPEKVTRDEIEIYTITVSDRLFADLVVFAKVFCARLKIYNDSLDVSAKDYDDKVAKMPSCFEQIVQDNVIGNLSQSVATNIDKEYDEDFDEMEKKLKEKLGDKMPPKRDTPKKE